MHKYTVLFTPIRADDSILYMENFSAQQRAEPVILAAGDKNLSPVDSVQHKFLPFLLLKRLQKEYKETDCYLNRDWR